MTHPFAAYFAKHNRYPRIRLHNGVQKIEVEFAPGYTRIKTYPRGGEIYIVRSTWIALLRRVIPLTRKSWDHEDFDVPAAMNEASAFEATILREKRQLKKHRKRGKYEGSGFRR